MSEEVGGLGGTSAGVWVSKVITATDESGVGGPDVVVREFRVNKGGAFSCLLSEVSRDISRVQLSH